MALKELASSYTGGDAGRRLVYTEAAAPLAQALADGRGAGEDDGVDTAVRVDLAPSGREVESVERALASAGDRDVVVLLCVSLPENLPVGPLVDVVTRAGARVVRVEGLRTRHARTALVLTRDASVPGVSYLLGHAVSEDDSAQRRLANEWQLEGLQLRALAATLERRLEGALSEAAALRVEKAAVESRLSAQAKEHARSVASLERRLAEGGLGPRIRRAARTISSDPVGGSRKVAKAVVRRASR
ncbi:hypothetical protein N798_11235 [Knoellia flava TL1]|uniref:Uncharacterized protein n=2 Tax=Knoellia flava TaxID=913969 RepID=A0A8H9FVM4_9MICO|nr:hypothetical protein [Knoellia flava]KGN30268.1 hypothetical protein N798_11235 [Knoellia flava TL1]GGB84484.1 hypothetical protein GCM10011314_25170 [Knoellia flava]